MSREALDSIDQRWAQSGEQEEYKASVASGEAPDSTVVPPTGDWYHGDPSSSTWDGWSCAKLGVARVSTGAPSDPKTSQ